MNTPVLRSVSMIALLGFSCGKKVNQPTVKVLDLNRYMGTWYEIARFDHSFERGLAGVTATYALKEDGKISVLNQGYKGGLNGKKSSASGKARMPDKNEPGKLEVSFFAFFYAPYWVLDLDTTDYQYALIGSPGQDYLWILGRKPQMDADIYERLTQKAAHLGYDVSKLLKVEQAEK